MLELEATNTIAFRTLEFGAESKIALVRTAATLKELATTNPLEYPFVKDQIRGASLFYRRCRRYVRQKRRQWERERKQRERDEFVKRAEEAMRAARWVAGAKRWQAAARCISRDVARASRATCCRCQTNRSPFIRFLPRTPPGSRNSASMRSAPGAPPRGATPPTAATMTTLPATANGPTTRTTTLTSTRRARGRTASTW